ncbi:MAG: putative deoxycytidine triphosphate deaminase [Candidatus Nomurabacteria bacterium GW2011_GWC2_41_8]|nr:MAG: putative deoxycytidine triphosphate deaminase [Candidatus Nomurabacteria bacterium GW2011_GWA2_41_25]KKS24357.1 MAG: putative deoxycytidine triphosphate deaminase [Candidatus Nomurabacteria bacterium GW2011_GWC2_41_8]
MRNVFYMIFSKNTILKKIKQNLIKITDFNLSSLEEASYDLKLGSCFDKIKQTWDPISFHGLQIEPGSFVLAKTQEKITLSPKIACMIFTTSSLAKQGVDVIQSSSFCHPQTNNEITLEIVNHNSQPIIIKQRQNVAKAIFMEVI